VAAAGVGLGPRSVLHDRRPAELPEPAPGPRRARHRLPASTLWCPACAWRCPRDGRRAGFAAHGPSATRPHRDPTDRCAGRATHGRRASGHPVGADRVRAARLQV